ncbi:ribokinase [Deinococcus humi]|uniref:Ribokinase n=1 Tax=Deinococcus humi TaxID=662880 RepID=A0A7W8NIS6_9DEIO|nr:ribokinase [Deinococcus humi]GGO36185.1 ribokinase [Deinococcus humi]
MILVAGSVNIDFAVQVQALPSPGETVLGGPYRVSPGGKGANQAVASARAGARVCFVGCVGTDDHGQQLRQALDAEGIDTAYLRSVADQTGAAFVTVGADGENAIAVSSGANRALQASDLPELGGVTHLILQLESPRDAICAFAQAAHRAGVHITLNAAPAQALDDGLLRLVDLLIVNAGELETLCGPQVGRDLESQLKVMAGRGPHAIVVTLGADGAAVWANGQFHRTAAFNVPVVDTTGAGDTFVGVLVASLPHMDLASAAQRASAAAALTCTRSGAQISMPHSPAIEQLLTTARVEHAPLTAKGGGDLPAALVLENL